MRSNRLLKFGSVAGAAVAASMLLTGIDFKSDSSAQYSGTTLEVYELATSTDPFDQIARTAISGSLERLYYEEGAELGTSCLEFGDMALLIHPDTDPARLEEVLQRMQEFYDNQAIQGKVGYNSGGRWSNTASGPTGVSGDPITLTWGYVPDGTWIPSEGTGSNLFAVFDVRFPNPATWQNKISNAFLRWDNALGTTYIFEPNDDGVNLTSAGGVLGVRPDIRMAGASVDGSNGVLAYNWYPDNGDMVIDTDDWTNYTNPTGNYTFLKNVVMHEHGHGMGLGHVIPTSQTKLMEPFASIAFIGPQDDDIRGGQRYYGDIYETNDNSGTATNLGALAEPTVWFSDMLSIDRGADEDFYLLSMTNTDLEVVIDPLGSTYDLGNQGGSTSPITTDEIDDPDVELLASDGSTVLFSATSGSYGDTETMNATGLAPGDYYIRVFRKAGTGNGIQRYSMQITPSGSATSVAAGDLPVSRSLDVAVAPNPFNPTTQIRFNAAAPGPYTVDIIDISGRLVRNFDGHASSAGQVDLQWDGRHNDGVPASSGVYLINVSAAGQREVKRATLVR